MCASGSSRESAGRSRRSSTGRDRRSRRSAAGRPTRRTTDERPPSHRNHRPSWKPLPNQTLPSCCSPAQAPPAAEPCTDAVGDVHVVPPRRPAGHEPADHLQDTPPARNRRRPPQRRVRPAARQRPRRRRRRRATWAPRRGRALSSQTVARRTLGSRTEYLTSTSGLDDEVGDRDDQHLPWIPGRSLSGIDSTISWPTPGG